MKNWLDTIRTYYLSGLWSKEQVLAVVGKVLTEEEANAILSSR